MPVMNQVNLIDYFAEDACDCAGARTGEAFGNRMELEVIDQKVRHDKEAAPFAMAEARAEMRNWQQGGRSPRMPASNKVQLGIFHCNEAAAKFCFELRNLA